VLFLVLIFQLVSSLFPKLDREVPEIIRVTETEFIVDGNITTNEVELLLEKELSPKDILSIGGFITDQLGHFPETGEVLRLDEAELIVERVLDNAVERVRVKKVNPKTAPEDSGDSIPSV